MFKGSRFKSFIAGLFVSLMVIASQSFADTVSLQTNYVSGEADIVSHLNNDRTSLTNGVNSVRGVYSGSAQSSGQIKAATIGQENCADDMNPRVRTYEGASCEKVVTGLLPATTVGTLTGSVPAGTAYPKGYRVDKSSGTAHNFTASKWTWVDLVQDGTFSYLEQAIGSATPALTANAIRLALVSTDTTQIGYVLDLRTTNCSNGPLSGFSDAAGEASIGDIFVYGSGGVHRGLNLTKNDATSVTLNPGSAYIMGDYRTQIAATNVPVNSLGNSLTGVAGLDIGVVAPGTTYYLYGTADIDGTKTIIGILSKDDEIPTGPTKYRKLGETTTDASSSLVSADATSISYEGKIRQIKKYETGELVTCATVMVDDDTIPTYAEGNLVLNIPFTPISAKNRLRIDVVVNADAGTTAHVIALYQDGSGVVPAICASMQRHVNGYASNLKLSHNMIAGTTSATSFQVRLGDAAGTTYMNGTGGARRLGGVMGSSITITEYEP